MNQKIEELQKTIKEEGLETSRQIANKWIHDTNILINKNKWQTPEYEQDKLNKRGKGNMYVFFREDMWYPIEMYDDADAIKNAEHNPGTIKVENSKEEVVWELKNKE